MLGALVVDLELFGALQVVEDDHPLVAHDGHLADLVRVEPAHVDVRHRALVEIEGHEDDVFDPRLEIGLPTRRHVRGLEAEQVEDDGDVVGGEAPERVFVPAHRAEIHALIVDVVDVAELVRVDHLLDATDDRVIQEQVADHEDPPLVLGELDQLLRLHGEEHEGLLDVHVLAGLQRGLDQGVVRGRGSGDHEGVEVPVLQEVLEPGGGSGPRQEPPHLVELPLIEIADVRERTVGDLKVVAGQVLAPAADAGHRDLDHPLIHGSHLRD